MKNKIAIIVTAYNRPHALKNLLKSLERIRCSRDITLVISIDNYGTYEVNKTANDFIWNFGEKIVIIHKEKLGLRNHFIWVGDQTEKYENVVFLEDDLVVSPELLNFAEASITFYSDDDDVAGLCLYNPILCEFNGCKYYQNQDGYDVYFLQHPYWGNIWIKDKWKKFKEWLIYYKPNYAIIPQKVSNWKDTSFKKIYIQYLVEKNKYIVVPRISIVTNNGEVGLHNTMGLYQYQVVLMNERMSYRFCKCGQSKTIYDSYMELLPEIIKYYNKDLLEFDFEVDLKGNRHIYNKEYVLTTRPTKKCLKSFSSLMKPMENGIIYASEGDGISLSRVEDIIEESHYDKIRLYKDIDMNYVMSLRAIILFLKREVIWKIRSMFK